MEPKAYADKATTVELSIISLKINKAKAYIKEFGYTSEIFVSIKKQGLNTVEHKTEAVHLKEDYMIFDSNSFQVSLNLEGDKLEVALNLITVLKNKHLTKKMEIAVLSLKGTKPKHEPTYQSFKFSNNTINYKIRLTQLLKAATLASINASSPLIVSMQEAKSNTEEPIQMKKQVSADVTNEIGFRPNLKVSDLLSLYEKNHKETRNNGALINKGLVDSSIVVSQDKKLTRTITDNSRFDKIRKAISMHRNSNQLNNSFIASDHSNDESPQESSFSYMSNYNMNEGESAFPEKQGAIKVTDIIKQYESQALNRNTKKIVNFDKQRFLKLINRNTLCEVNCTKEINKREYLETVTKNSMNFEKKRSGNGYDSICTQQPETKGNFNENRFCEAMFTVSLSLTNISKIESMKVGVSKSIPATCGHLKCSENSDIFTPEIISKVTFNESKNLEINQILASLCFPLGIKICYEKEYRIQSLTPHLIISSTIDGSKFYIMAYICLQKSNSILFYPNQKSSDIYIPVAVCLLSKYPFAYQMEQCLVSIVKMMSTASFTDNSPLLAANPLGIKITEKKSSGDGISDKINELRQKFQKQSTNSEIDEIPINRNLNFTRSSKFFDTKELLALPITNKSLNFNSIDPFSSSIPIAKTRLSIRQADLRKNTEYNNITADQSKLVKLQSLSKYSVESTSELHSIECIYALIIYILAEIPIPAIDERLFFYVPFINYPVEIYYPLYMSMEVLNYSTSIIFDYLSIDSILTIFNLILLEQKIIFVTQSICILPKVIESFTALIYPFIWTNTLVPILSSDLLKYVQSPIAFIMGVEERLLSSMQEYLEEDNNIFFIYLNKNVISKKLLPESQNTAYANQTKEEFMLDLSDLPVNVQMKLSERLQELKIINEKSKQEFIPIQSKVYEKFIDRKIRQAFVVAMAEMLSGYTKYLSYMDELPVFNEKVFICNKSRRDRDFYEKLVETQNFNYFLQLDTKIQAPYFHRKLNKNVGQSKSVSRRGSKFTNKREARKSLSSSDTLNNSKAKVNVVDINVDDKYLNPRPSTILISLFNKSSIKAKTNTESNNNSFEDEINNQDFIFIKNHVLVPTFNMLCSTMQSFENETEAYVSFIEKFNGTEAVRSINTRIILPELCVHRLDLGLLENKFNDDSIRFNLNEFSNYVDYSKKISYEISLSMSKKRHSSFSLFNKQISSINVRKFNLNNNPKASIKSKIKENDNEESVMFEKIEEKKSIHSTIDVGEKEEIMTREIRKHSIINRNRGKNIRELNPKQKEIVEEFISETMKSILTSKPISQKNKSSLDSFFKLKDSKRVFAAFLYQSKFEEEENICLANQSFLELTEIVFFILLQSADEKYFNDFFYHSIMLVTKSCFHYYTEKGKNQVIFMYQQLTKKQGSFKVWTDSLFWEYWLLFLLNQENRFESDSDFVFNKFIILMNYMFKLKIPGGNINLILCKDLGNSYLLNSDREKLKILISKQQMITEVVGEADVYL